MTYILILNFQQIMHEVCILFSSQYFSVGRGQRIVMQHS